MRIKKIMMKVIRCDIDENQLGIVTFQDWNCCTKNNPCKVEMTGDCDEDEDCDGDLLCGTNNCGQDDRTGEGGTF